MALTINNPRYGNIFVVADTFAELRRVSSKQINEGYSAIVAGDLTPGDGFGGMLVWNSTSTSSDDSRTTIASQDGKAGRWIKIAIGDVGPQGAQGEGLATIMTAGGSGLVGYKGRTVAARLSDEVSPLDYGATGDGSVDDTAAIDLALAAGRTVIFPAGYIFKTSGNHRITRNSQQLIVNGVIRHDGVRRDLGGCSVLKEYSSSWTMCGISPYLDRVLSTG